MRLRTYLVDLSIAFRTDWRPSTGRSEMARYVHQKSFKRNWVGGTGLRTGACHRSLIRSALVSVLRPPLASRDPGWCPRPRKTCRNSR